MDKNIKDRINSKKASIDFKPGDTLLLKFGGNFYRNTFLIRYYIDSYMKVFILLIDYDKSFYKYDLDERYSIESVRMVLTEKSYSIMLKRKEILFTHYESEIFFPMTHVYFSEMFVGKEMFDFEVGRV